MISKIVYSFICIFYFTMTGLAGAQDTADQAEVMQAFVNAARHVQAEYLAEPPELPLEVQEQIEILKCELSNLPGPPTPEEEGAQPQFIVPDQLQTDVQERTPPFPLAPGDFKMILNRDLGSGAPSNYTSVVNEPSAGNNGDLVFYSGNWYASLSTDGGNTFSFVNPYTTFPQANNGFCCDQDVIYDSSRDLMLWLLQYVQDGNSNTHRIAVARGPANLANGNWYYYDFNPQMIGLPDDRWFDYPHLALSNNYLIHAANVYTTGDDPTWTNTVLMMMPLNGLASGGGFNFSFIIVGDRFNFTPVQGATNVVYWASHNTTSSIRIYRWAEGSGSYTLNNVGHSTYSRTWRGDAHCPGPDGRDWCGRYDDRIMAGWVANSVIGFMWNVAEGGSFPYPYTRIARFNESNRSLIDEPIIWNQEFAWAYPSVGVNARGHIAGTIFWGGGNSHPSTAAWISDDVNGDRLQPLEVYFVTAGTDGPIENKWGDYLRSRPHHPVSNTWIATAFALQGGGNNSDTRPRYVWFGRERDVPTFPPRNVYALSGYHHAVPLVWDPPKDQSPLAEIPQMVASAGPASESISGKGAELLTKGDGDSPAQTLLSYNIYRSTTPGGPYTLIRSGLQRQYYRDESAENGTRYYYVVKAVYDIGTSDNSNEANAMPVYRGYQIFSGWNSTPPSLDGIINPLEWNNAAMVNITHPGLLSPVTMYVMNNDDHLYLAIADQGNKTLDNLDEVGFYFDEDLDRDWPPESPSDEGNFWIDWFTTGTSSRFRGISGWWPGNINLEAAGSAAGVIQAISNASGYLQYEIDIDLSTSALNASPGDIIGWFAFALANPGMSYTGYWPQAQAPLRFRNVWQVPAAYGDLIMAERPEVMVTWCDDNLIGFSGTRDTVYICVDSLDGLNVVAYQLEIEYDNNLLTAVGATSESTISEDFGPPVVNTLIPGRMIVGGFGTDPLSGAGRLVGLIFDVTSKPGDTTLICIDDALFNAGIPFAVIPDPCCPYVIPNTWDIDGLVTYCPTDDPVPNTTMTLSGAASRFEFTDADGYYQFRDVAGNFNYTVTPSKTGDIGESSITCFDASLISQIALNLRDTTHCEALAADVDKNGLIQLFDAALTCRYAVGLPPYDITDHTGTWMFEPPQRSYLNITSNHRGENYVAVLLGDVDGNWTPAVAGAVTATGDKSDGITNIVAAPGETVILPLMARSGEKVYAVDAGLTYDSKILEFLDVGRAGLNEEFELVVNSSPGRLKLGAYCVNPGGETGDLLNVYFKVVGSEGQMSAITLDRYLINGINKPAPMLSLRISEDTENVPKMFALGQNYPNPFNPETNIPFHIPALEQKRVNVKISIYNSSGQLVCVLLNEERPAGTHEVRWNTEDASGRQVSSGIYFYTITAGEFEATRKMLLIR